MLFLFQNIGPEIQERIWFNDFYIGEIYLSGLSLANF